MNLIELRNGEPAEVFLAVLKCREVVVVKVAEEVRLDGDAESEYSLDDGQGSSAHDESLMLAGKVCKACQYEGRL
jgi:hypothetical protein